VAAQISLIALSSRLIAAFVKSMGVEIDSAALDLERRPVNAIETVCRFQM
jgi:hypothetical protein